MRYQAYEIRREVLGYKADDYLKSLMVLLEYIDWSTGEKVASNQQHMKNWLFQLSSKYNLEPSLMVKSIDLATEKGWFEREVTSNGQFILRLGQKPELSLMDEPGPVEPVEVPHYKRDGWVALTRERIRELTPCPKCGAPVGLMCKGNKKGEHNREANHKERSQTASRIAKELFDKGIT